jgi:hypothetical protein
MRQTPHDNKTTSATSLREALLLAETARNSSRFDEAILAYRNIADLHPNAADAWAGLGKTLHLNGHFEESFSALHRAIALDPRQADAHAALGILLLMHEHFSEGWNEYEWRLLALAGDGAHFPEIPLQRADLEREGGISGKHIYVEADQGLGDTLQFVRYIPWLVGRGAEITLRVDQRLVSLLEANLRGVKILGDHGKTEPYHRDAALLSLPYLSKTSLETIPGENPYLQPPQKAASRWQHRLAPVKGLKVGLVWAGNPEHLNDQRRSFGFAAFEPFLTINGIHFVSLQAGARAADLHSSKAIDTPVEDLSSSLTDFAETAAAVAALDLVISVDTAVAHLAGAMGKPIWLLLPWVSDWRWMLNRDDSPWYPTMRLFRQKQDEEIAMVIARAAAELRKLAVV